MEKKRTKIFLDTEFTGLYQDTELISIGLVSECGREFYVELSDFDIRKCDGWIIKNVLANLLYIEDEEHTHKVVEYLASTRGVIPSNESGPIFKAKTSVSDLRETLTLWLSAFEAVEVWSDCLAYDWVLFCTIFGGASHIPDNVYYIPFDLATMFKIKGVDPDISREEYCGLAGTREKHNAFFDAGVIKECWDRVRLLR